MAFEYDFGRLLTSWLLHSHLVHSSGKVTLSNAIRFVCYCFFLSSIVSRLTLYTNLHVEIIVNHMFYEHQSRLFVYCMKRKNSKRRHRRIHFVLLFISLSVSRCFHCVWIDDNVLFYCRVLAISKFEMIIKLLSLLSLSIRLWMLVPQSYLFGMVFVCKMKAILNAIFLFCSITELNYISYFVVCVCVIHWNGNSGYTKSECSYSTV